MSDPKAIAQKFCHAYFGVMQTDRSKVGTFYRENSKMTFMGKEFTGVSAIVQRLTQLGSTTGTPAQVKYQITKCDVQVSKAPNSLVLLLVGQLSIDGAPPIRWVQFAHLTTDDGAQWYLFNDIFRLLLD